MSNQETGEGNDKMKAKENERLKKKNGEADELEKERNEEELGKSRDDN